MNDAAFLAAIRETPEDDTLRLIYADWLDEHGQEERAEFIRAQIELSRGVADRGRILELQQRLRELLQKHRAQWLGPLADLNVRDANFERGFVVQVSLSGDDFVKHGAEILAAHPIFRLRLRESRTDLRSLGKCAELAQLRSLNLREVKPIESALWQFIRSDHLRPLRDLKFGPPMPGDLVQGIVSSANLGELINLELSHCDLGNSQIEQLARSFALPRLQRLDLAYNRISTAGAEALAGCSRLRRVQTLRLAVNRLRMNDALLLLRSTALSSLQILDLASNEISVQEAADLRREGGSRIIC